MPIYLCEECGRERFRPDLTLGGLYQIWLKHPRDKWPGFEEIGRNGYGPNFELCEKPSTTFMVQFIGHANAEDQAIKSLRERISGQHEPPADQRLARIGS